MTTRRTFIAGLLASTAVGALPAAIANLVPLVDGTVLTDNMGNTYGPRYVWTSYGGGFAYDRDGLSIGGQELAKILSRYNQALAASFQDTIHDR